MKLSKKSIAYRTLSRFGATFIFLIFLAGPLAAVLFLPLVIGIAVYEYVYWKKYEFNIENGDIKITSGVITRNNLDIPVRRVQNVDINRNIIHRIFDIAELKIETAGGSTTEASLRYLDLEDAETVRNEIRQLKDRRKERDSEKESSETSKNEDYVLSNRNLAILGLTSSAPSTAIISVLLFVSAFTGTVIYAETVMQMLGGLATAVIGTAILSGIWMVLGGINTFTKYYGFTVERRNDVIEYEMGLINRQGGTIPKEKIQSIFLEENFLKRYLGFATLKVETAGANVDQDQGFNPSTVLIPLDRRENIVEYMENIGKFQTPEMHRIDDRARKRYTHRYLLLSTILAVPAIGAVAAGFSPAILILPVLAGLLSKKAAQLKWENIGYVFGENNIFVMTGFWKRKTYTVPYFRVQNLMKTESVFQRRWKQASITIDTAGSIWTNPVIPDMDRENAEEARNYLFSKFRDSIY